jgi:predicted P-loop ATPase
VFVGTTNKEQFLTDKTGNRRWYPLKANSSGYDIFDHEKEIKADIIQCWAEAKHLYDEGKLYPYADRSLLTEIRKKQADAVEDDYRVGMIEAYCKRKDKVCIIELWQQALNNDHSKPTRKDSNEISLILQSLKGWSKGKVERSQEYGNQQYWVKSKEQSLKEKFEDLPDTFDILPE